MLAPAATGFDDHEMVRLLPLLRRFAMSLTRANRAEAEDLVQETVIRAIENRHRFTRDRNLSAWLTTILRNHHRTLFRRSGRTVADPDDALAGALAGPDDPLQPLLLKDVLRRVAFLPPEQREAVLLAADGLAYEQIASEQDVPVGTVKSRLSRARATLGGH